MAQHGQFNSSGTTRSHDKTRVRTRGTLGTVPIKSAPRSNSPLAVILWCIATSARDWTADPTCFDEGSPIVPFRVLFREATESKTERQHHSMKSRIRN